MRGALDHWEEVYCHRAEEDLSWHEPSPSGSVEVIQRYCPSPKSRVIDVGSGTSRIVDLMLDHGYTNLTLLDISQEALYKTRARLGAKAKSVHFITADILDARGLGQFDLWHDRALFHFLVSAADRLGYARTAARSIVPGGHLVIGTFAPDGPKECSGLPVRRYDADEFAEVFGAGFTPVAAHRNLHTTPWGTVQPFTVAVLKRNATG
ncbi:MAG: class I SAM-dependent methyltransferase [Fimbriimonadaceae bacterium]